MREIKFRVWDKKRASMSEPLHFGETFVNVREPKLDMTLSIPLADIRRFADQFEVMQFTGLKGKNGIEIYEGDLVMYANDYLSGDIPPEPPEPHNDFAVVQYSNLHTAFIGNAHFKGNHEKHATPLHLVVDEYGSLEVIGNVHENPELLEAEPAP